MEDVIVSNQLPTGDKKMTNNISRKGFLVSITGVITAMFAGGHKACQLTKDDIAKIFDVPVETFLYSDLGYYDLKGKFYPSLKIQNQYVSRSVDFRWKDNYGVGRYIDHSRFKESYGYLEYEYDCGISLWRLTGQVNGIGENVVIEVTT